MHVLYMYIVHSLCSISYAAYLMHHNEHDPFGEFIVRKRLVGVFDHLRSGFYRIKVPLLSL